MSWRRRDERKIVMIGEAKIMQSASGTSMRLTLAKHVANDNEDISPCSIVISFSFGLPGINPAFLKQNLK